MSNTSLTWSELPEEGGSSRKQSIPAGPVDSAVRNKLRALIIAAADQASEWLPMYHKKNTTGIVGQRSWSDDEQVNKLWKKFSKSIGSGSMIPSKLRLTTL